MIDSQTERSALWETLRVEADKQPGFRADTLHPNLSGPPVTIIEKFQGAWQGSALPLMVAALCLVLSRGGWNRILDDRLTWGLIGAGWLVATVALSWLLAPLLRDRQGIRPARLLGLGLAMIWYLPASTAVLFLLLEMKGLARFESYSHTWTYLFLAQDGGGLLFCIASMVLLYLLARRVRSSAPWYDQRAFSRDRLVLARWTAGLPVLAYLGLMIWLQPGSSLLDWEREVRAAHPELVALASYQPPEPSQPWNQLEARVRGAAVKNPSTLQKAEEAALKIGTEEPRGGWTSSTYRDAENVLERLLDNRLHLRRPVELLCLYYRLAPLDGGAGLRLSYLSNVLKPMVLEGKASREELEQSREHLQDLMASCPERVGELDRRIYTRGFVHRPRSISQGLFAKLLHPPLLHHALYYRELVGAWTRVRPELLQGATWKELRESPDSELAEAAEVLRDVFAESNQQDSLRPELETWLLLIEIRLWIEEHGTYPLTLDSFELYRSQPGRWSWLKSSNKGGWSLREEGEPYPKTWGFQ